MRVESDIRFQQKNLPIVHQGSLFIKYSLRGKPDPRWFFVSPSGCELMWMKPPKDGKRPLPPKEKVSTKTSGSGSGSEYAEEVEVKKHRRGASTSSGFSFRLFNWKLGDSRKRSLFDVVAVYYGPFRSSKQFARYLDGRDAIEPQPWLCFTIEFNDRTIDLVASDESSVTVWFLLLQSLCPLSIHYLSRGALLWQRLIMKLNHYGLDRIRDPPAEYKHVYGSAAYLDASRAANTL